MFCLQIGYCRKRWVNKFFYVEAPLLDGWVEWNFAREEWVNCEMGEKASILFTKLKRALPFYGMNVGKTVSTLICADSFSSRSWVKHFDLSK